jgi:hypothetical protein
LFHWKYESIVSLAHYKMWLVTCGFIQWESLNYVKTFSPVFKMTSLWILFSLANLYDYHIHQIDVTTAFLNGILHKEIYISPLEVYMSTRNETKVCFFLKSLYGLKQAHMFGTIFLTTTF